MSKQQKLEAMISDFVALARKHNVVLDKYVHQDRPTEYFFKLQFEDAEVNIEDVFPPVYHGPARQ